jgi:hypothetical protein
MTNIITIRTDDGIFSHAPSCFDDHTLCGLDATGDDEQGIKVMGEGKGKITCLDCIKIIEYCKKIRL